MSGYEGQVSATLRLARGSFGGLPKSAVVITARGCGTNTFVRIWFSAGVCCLVSLDTELVCVCVSYLRRTCCCCCFLTFICLYLFRNVDISRKSKLPFDLFCIILDIKLLISDNQPRPKEGYGTFQTLLPPFCSILALVMTK